MFISVFVLICFGIVNCHYSNIPRITEIEEDIESIKNAQTFIYGAMDTIETDVAQKIQNLGLISATQTTSLDDIDFEKYEERLVMLEDTIDSLQRYLMTEKRKDIGLKRRSEVSIDQINAKLNEAKELIGSTEAEMTKSVSDFEIQLKSVNKSAQRNMDVKGVIVYGGVGTSCLTGHDVCVVDKSECRGGRCQCEAGYSYDAFAQQCVTSCKGYGLTFQSVENRVIRGHNDDIVENVSFLECKQHCLNATGFVCRSIDYFERFGECYLSSVTMPEVKDDWEYNSIGCHFQRDCEK